MTVEPHDPELRIVQGSQGQRRETGFPVPSLNAMRPDLSGRGSTGEFRHSRYPQRQYLIVAGLLFHLFVSIRVISGQAVLFVAMLLAPSVWAVEYTVGPGDDVDAAIAKLKPGDVLVAAEGVYKKQWTISGLKGTKEEPIRITGLHDQPTTANRTTDEHGFARMKMGRRAHATVIRPDQGKDGILFWGGGGSEHVIVENIRVEGAERAGIIVNGSRHVTIRNCALISNGVWGIQTCMSDYVAIEDCEASGSKTQHGIYFSTTDHPIVRRTIVRGNTACGIQMNGDGNEGGDGVISDGIIEDNIITGNGRKGGAAINMDGVQSMVVRRNLLVDNFSGGITTFRQGGAKPGRANEFRENTVLFEPGRGRFGLEIIDGAKDIVSVSNILVCGKGPALVVGSSSRRGLVSDQNAYYVYGDRNPIQYGWRRRSLAQWREKTGLDMNSTVAAWRFVEKVRDEARERAGRERDHWTAGPYED